MAEWGVAPLPESPRSQNVTVTHSQQTLPPVSHRSRNVTVTHCGQCPLAAGTWLSHCGQCPLAAGTWLTHSLTHSERPCLWPGTARTPDASQSGRDDMYQNKCHKWQGKPAFLSPGHGLRSKFRNSNNALAWSIYVPKIQALIPHPLKTLGDEIQ